MPYTKNSELPEAVRNALPDDAQSIFRSAYMEAEKKWPGTANEGKRASYAWGAVGKAFEKGKTGKWTKKSAESQAAESEHNPEGSHEAHREGLDKALRWTPALLGALKENYRLLYPDFLFIYEPRAGMNPD